MPKAVIHVNRHFIAKNRQDGGNRPVYTAKVGRKTIYAHGFKIEGTIVGIDPRTTKPLKCGAVAYLAVTEGNVSFIDPCSFREAQKIARDL